MRKIQIIVALLFFSCEQVVIIELPPEQNLLVVEGFLTDVEEKQKVRLTRSNSFSGSKNSVVEDAAVSVDMRNSPSITYAYSQGGNYLSNNAFSGTKGEEYRVTIVLQAGDLIRSDWTTMSFQTQIVLLSVDSFEENDENNPGQTKTIYFPRITARDSADFGNYYRWILFKDGDRLTEPESITLQNDRFFDGNFIPNLFDQFEYADGEEMKVELHAIEKGAYDYLNLLKSQITTLGGVATATPASINGNMNNLSNPEESVLGYFGTAAISSDSVTVE